MELTQEELKTLVPFCPCRICTQSWPAAILGFFTHGNCRTCHGCLQSGEFQISFVNPDFITKAREAKLNSDTQPTSYSE